MASTSTPTTAAVQTVDVLPLTPERFADLAALFEEGGDPKWCWCVYFRFRGRDWSNSTAAENRAALEALDRPRAGRPGLVAYQDGRAVGLGQPRPARGLRAPRLVEGPGARRRHAGLVDRLLRGVAASPRRGRRGGPAGRRRRVCAASRARRLSRPIRSTRPADADPRRERLSRHARDVRAGRLPGRRAAPVNADEPGPADRPASLDPR